MRLFIILMLTTAVFATDSISFFKKDLENQLLCHLGQYSFKMVSQKNSVMIKIHEHIFFKLKDENLYFLNNTCQPLEVADRAIIF